MDCAGFAFRGDHSIASIRMQAKPHYSMTRRSDHIFGGLGAAGGFGTVGGLILGSLILGGLILGGLRLGGLIVYPGGI